MAHVNIEVKAKCPSPDKIREILYSRQANYKGTDHQIDTYFKVNSGRLKLREGGIENYLIYYHRENRKGPKQSDVIFSKIKPGSSVKQILIKSLGVLVTVDKQREIYFIENIKFHIDMVKNLGTFIEIEAQDEKGAFGRKKLAKQCQSFLNLFKISFKDLVPYSYSDLLLKTKNRFKTFPVDTRSCVF